MRRPRSGRWAPPSHPPCVLAPRDSRGGLTALHPETGSVRPSAVDQAKIPKPQRVYGSITLITITEKSRSAVLALTELARRGGSGPVPILEVAEARAIPLHFLEQIFAGLRRAGILQSQRGVKGGYSFRRPPAEVTILEVVETVDGRLGPPGGDAPGADAVWNDARDALAELLGGLTIADIQEREARYESAPMFHI